MEQGDLNTLLPDLYFPMILRGSGFTDLHEGVSDDFTFLLRVDGLVERPGLHLVGHGVRRVGGDPRVRRVERVRRVHS